MRRYGTRCRRARPAPPRLLQPVQRGLAAGVGEVAVGQELGHVEAGLLLGSVQQLLTHARRAGDVLERVDGVVGGHEVAVELALGVADADDLAARAVVDDVHAGLGRDLALHDSAVAARVGGGRCGLDLLDGVVDLVAGRKGVPCW